MDIDMLGITSNEEAVIVAQIQQIMSLEVKPDGVIYNPDTIRAERIVEDADYEGIRIGFKGTLDNARFSMQIDIGFGDVIHPASEKLDLPTMLEFPAPTLLGYSRESTIAEKFEAMVKLGILNSRMKDFYDIWLLSRQFDFDLLTLAEAIRLTFKKRGTILPSYIEAFEKPFIDEKQVQWTAFRKRLQQDHVPLAFQDIVSTVKGFLTDPVTSLSLNVSAQKSWTAPGPWIEQ